MSTANLSDLPHYTFEDRAYWKGNWEIILGIPYAMMQASDTHHEMAARGLEAVFSNALVKKCCYPLMNVDYRVADDIILQPDFLVLCQEIKKTYLDFRPALTVEILMPSTELKDRHTKYDIYQQQGVPYYLIVNPQTEEVEVYVLRNELYVLVQKGHAFTHSFTFENDCSVTIDFGDIW